MRIVLGVVAGLVVAVLCVWAIEFVGFSIYPPPAGLDAASSEDMARIMAAAPLAALIFVVAAWFIGALIGAWVANALAKRALAGWIVALLVIAGGVTTMVMIPHPVWMWTAGIGLPILAAMLAQRQAKVAF